MSQDPQRPISSNGDLIHSAVASLISVTKWGETTFVRMPSVFPGGSHVTVAISKSRGGFFVSDHGFSFREIESVGCERSFGRAASVIAEKLEINRDARRFFVEVSADELARAIVDIAAASWSIVDKVYSNLDDENDEEMEEALAGKLISLFGGKNVNIKGRAKGSSATDWKVSAIVRSGRKRTIFQAVGAHPASVYRTSTAFRDLALVPSPPGLVSVVKSTHDMGHLLGLLSQAGNVIEEGQPDDVFVRSVG